MKPLLIGGHLALSDYTRTHTKQQEQPHHTQKIRMIPNEQSKATCQSSRNTGTN